MGFLLPQMERSFMFLHLTIQQTLRRQTAKFASTLIGLTRLSVARLPLEEWNAKHGVYGITPKLQGLVFVRHLNAVDHQDTDWRSARFEFETKLFLQGRKKRRPHIVRNLTSCRFLNRK